MGIKKEKTPCKQGFSPRHFFIKSDVLICVKTSPMIKTHRGALLSTLYTRLYHIYWYLHVFFAMLPPFPMPLHDKPP